MLYVVIDGSLYLLTPQLASDEDDYDDDEEEDATGQDVTSGDEDTDLLGSVAIYSG